MKSTILLFAALFLSLPNLAAHPPGPLSPTERGMAEIGLVDISRMDSTIVVDMIYATADNFVGEVLYEDITRAFLHPEAAAAVVEAQRLLAEKSPGARLVVYDAARPMSVQGRMHDKVAGTDKHIYVSNPANGGGLHNYGLAVDVSIIGPYGSPLDMGTPFDHLDVEANIDREEELVARGAISPEARENRILLREVMTGAGWMTLRSEWWHFNFRQRADAIARYRVIP
ncbi:MAG: M15 family metallopeptidase [Alistipes sp.]|jgi:D-alanyl-D-alanine dipeptidase|nr:M15 family metallopeptidase [Alistipes sp.]